MTLDGKIETIKTRIKKAQKKTGINHPVKIIAVTKTHPFSTIKKCYKSNLFSVGENKIQEAEKKFEAFKDMPKIEKRFIGHLQTNKVNKCLSLFDTIDTIDSFRLAKKISNSADRLGKKITGLIEVNTSGEAQKKGFLVNEVEKIMSCLDLPRLKIVGLMTMGPNTKNTNQIRGSFKKLRELKNSINQNRTNKILELSMGMSGDYEIAVEEGATMIRLGTILFGKRGAL